MFESLSFPSDWRSVMLAVNIRSRAVVALVGLCTVVGLMAVSVGAVQAGAAQTEQEAEEAAEAARAGHAYTEHLHKAVQHARQAAEAGRSRLAEHLAQARARWAEAGRHRAGAVRRALQDGPTRMRGGPRIAMRHRGPGGGGTAERVLRMAEELELSEQQEDEIREVRRQHRRASIEREAAIEVAGLDLEELMEDPHIADLAAVEQQMQAMSELRVEGRVADLRLTQQVWGVLTVEQRDQIQDQRHNIFMFARRWSARMVVLGR
ncbi:MAG TPA: Spy/CpxP family protein refolding chaperone [Acidobacteriota bacterium]|nr:Spy/CpxP family protein refolding chaperone [Acidobacteriota bacterium]